MANSIDALNSRFAVSKFDVTKKLSDDQITLLKDSLRLTPSSMNIQPWKFTLSDLRTKLSDGNFEFTTLVDCCMHVYYDTLAKQRSEPLAATIYLLPHIDGK